MNRSRKQPTSPLIRKLAVVTTIVFTISLGIASTCSAARLDEMPLERWAKMREVERYQMQIAERYYREKKWKVAGAEYEKYLTLYERSNAASYAQLKWSLCQVLIRRQNTAIKEGFQSVLDYWPDSPDAIAATYYIGNTYKNIGEIKKAKKSYRAVLSKHASHLAGIYAANDLIAISLIEEDLNSRVKLWKQLTFDVKRTRDSKNICVKASQQYAAHNFSQLAVADAVKALATTYTEEQLPYYVLTYARGPIETYMRDTKTKAKGEKLADLTIAYIRGKIPVDRSNEEAKKQALNDWFYIADLHSAARRDTEVPKVYDQIGKMFGIDDVLLGRLAQWYKSRARYDEARKVYGRFKDKAAGMGQVAYSHRQQGKYDQAVIAYRQALGLDPENSIKWKNEIANNYRYGRKYTEAIGIYTELLSEDIDHIGRWQWEIANCHRDAGRYKEAIGVYRQCSEYYPSNYQQMAYCHRRLKQYNQAIVLYLQTSAEKNLAAWSLIQIAYTREEAKQTELAINAFQQVCRKFPKDRYASEAHAYLQNKYKINVTLGGAKDE